MAFSIGQICLGGTAEDVRHLLAISLINPVPENHILASVASSAGRGDVVRVLLEDGRMDPMFNNGSPLRQAIYWHCHSSVRALLADPRVDPGAIATSIVWAAECNELELLERLLADPRIDPSVNNNEAIVESSRKGHIAIVKRLLADPRVDPTVHNNYALGAARYSAEKELEALLLADPRVAALDAQTKKEA